MNMKRIFIFFSIISTGLLFSFNLQGQQICKDYQLKKCGGYGPPFKYSGQSKNAMMEKGQTSSFYLVTYGGFEYSVTLCADKSLDGIFFRIREDNPQKTIMYDSSTDPENMMTQQFQIDKSKRLIVEITVPESDKPATEEKYEDRSGCVGIVVEYNKAPAKGF